MSKMHRLAFELPDFVPHGRFLCDDSGHLMTVSVNPYNGNALVRFAAHDYSFEALSDAFYELERSGFLYDLIYRPDSFDNFHIPEV